MLMLVRNKHDVWHESHAVHAISAACLLLLGLWLLVVLATLGRILAGACALAARCSFAAGLGAMLEHEGMIGKGVQREELGEMKEGGEDAGEQFLSGGSDLILGQGKVGLATIAQLNDEAGNAGLDVKPVIGAATGGIQSRGEHGSVDAVFDGRHVSGHLPSHWSSAMFSRSGFRRPSVIAQDELSVGVNVKTENAIWQAENVLLHLVDFRLAGGARAAIGISCGAF